MTIPTTITDLSSIAGSNMPAGTDNIGTQLDDYLRAIQAIMRSESIDKEWETHEYTHTYSSATSFTISGTDVTSIYSVGRRIRAVGSSTGTIYGKISDSTFSTNTTVTVVWDSGSLVSETLTISLGAIRSTATGSTLSNSRSVDFDIGTMHGADIVSAATLDLDAATGNIIDITGTTDITAITLAEGRLRIVRFADIVTLNHGPNLLLPGGANITTAAGDYALLLGYASSVVRCALYVKADGTALVSSDVNTLDDLTDVALSSEAALDIIRRNAGNTAYENIPTAQLVIQQVTKTSTTTDSTTNTVPEDSSVPQTSEMDQASGLATSFTPKSDSSTILIEVDLHIGHNGSDNTAIAGITKDSGTSMLSLGLKDHRSPSDINTVRVVYSESSGSTSARTYKAWYGGDGSGTWYLNQKQLGTNYGGLSSRMTITEIL